VRVVVVGAGAIGGTIAWHLARAGHDVGVVDVRRDHLDAITRDGLVAEPSGEAVQVDTAPAAPVELVVVATKAFATEEAARGASHLVGDETLVATVQNGIGSEDVLADVFHPDRVLAGTTTIAAEAGAPGRVRLGESTRAGRSLTVLGCPPGRPELLSRVEAHCAAFTDAGLPATAVVDAAPARWRKLALAGSMGSLSGLLGATVGQTLAAAPEVLHALLDEIVAVAQAEGVALDLDETRATALAVYADTGSHRASLAVDLAEGRRTEIDAMCLEVVRRGAAHGVPTPVTEVVGRLVSARERC
jgi:2-dehydropantoate 2-reductase